MTVTKTFAFRMPPGLKAAAAALAKTHLYRPTPTPDTPDAVSAIHTGSINEALVSLATIGLEKMAEYVQATLNEKLKEQEAFAELMAFFLANPVTKVAYAADFPAGSPARILIEDSDEVRGEHELEGWHRSDAAHYYSGTQDHVLRLTAAKGAIRYALDEPGKLRNQQREEQVAISAKLAAERERRSHGVEPGVKSGGHLRMV